MNNVLPIPSEAARKVPFRKYRRTGSGRHHCIGFSIEGATDVNRPYVRNPATHALPRTRCPEEALLRIMLENGKIRQENLDKFARRSLVREDDREERELRGCVIQALTSEMISTMPGAVSKSRQEGLKSPADPQNRPYF